MAESILGVLRKDFQTDLANLADAATGGGVIDWPAYQNLIGRVNGIERCLQRVNELEKTMMEGDVNEH